MPRGDMPIFEALPPGDMPIFRAGPWTFVDWAQSWPRARDMSSAGRPPPCPGAGHEPRLPGPPDMPIIEALPPGTCPFLKPSHRGHAHFSSRAMDICGLCPALASGTGHVQRPVPASCRGRRTCPFVALGTGLPLPCASCLSGQALGCAMECRLRDGSHALTTEGMSNGGREPGTGPGCHAVSVAGSSL